MVDKFKDYFMTLEVHYLASQGVVKAAYKELSKCHHPDLGGDKEKFQEIQEAYEVLSNPVTKKTYEDKWLKYHSRLVKDFDLGMVTSIYDMAFQSARHIVLEYMYFILHKDYESAYALLSNYNRRRINKRDYIRWQSFIGEIHQLIDFDCIVESIQHTDNQENDRSIIEKMLMFKVKVRERNLILNRIEEEYFLRKVVYKNGVWRIRLSDEIDIKKIIKKYGKIIALNNKNNKKLKRMRPFIEDYYPTQELSLEIFIKRCEYEFERFVRYQNTFTIIKIQFDIDINQENLAPKINALLEKHTRKMDAFSQYESSSYVIILPETDLTRGQFVSQKISDLMQRDIDLLRGDMIKIDVTACHDKNVSVKEIFELIGIHE